MVVGDEFDGDRLAELNPRSRTCVVLGGRGFIGRSLVLRLLRLGKWIVRVADSAHSLRLDPPERDSLLSHALASGRASYHHVDVRDKSLLVNAIEGSSVVFFFNDADLRTDDFYLRYMIIVQGAKNVINACRECKVRRLIYNSSSDVVCDGLHDIVNGDELLPYPQRFQDSLNELKSEAEALILFANSIDGLLTCAIRPCNVYGPGDTDLVPYFVNLARSSWAKFIIGSGENISDFTYVENVSHAHICAEESLHFRMASIAGKAFFISDLDAMNFWDFSFLILGGLGYQRRPPLIKLPVSMVWRIFMFMKWMHRKWGFPKFGHFVFRCIQLALYSRTFNCLEAQKHIGYTPVVSVKEGVSQTIRSFSHLAHDMSFSRYVDRDEPSKAEKLLGGGNVAEILLWRDEKRSFTCFLTFVLLFNWFFLSGRTFAASVAKLSLLSLSVLFVYGILPPNVFGFPVKRVSLSCFEIPEVVVKDSVTEIAHMWNRGFQCISSLAQQQDWTIFLKVSAFLYFLKVSSQSLTMVIGIALVFSFTAFFVYEQYESEIDGLGKHLFKSVKELAGLLKKNLPHSVASILCNDTILSEDKRPVAENHWK